MTKTKERAEDTCSLVCQCRLPLSTSTVNHPADLPRLHLKAIRSRWRILPPGRIAVIVVAVLCHHQRLAGMADGNNVSESTVRRRRDELIILLAAQGPATGPRPEEGRQAGRGGGPDRWHPHPPPSAAPGRPTGGTTPANTTITACTSSP